MYIYTMTKSTLQRQKIIADLIDSGNISSQNQLKGLLKKNTLLITQATLSRDLNELGAIKKRQKDGLLVYVLPKDQDNNAHKKIAINALNDFVLDEKVLELYASESVNIEIYKFPLDLIFVHF